MRVQLWWSIMRTEELMLCHTWQGCARMSRHGHGHGWGARPQAGLMARLDADTRQSNACTALHCTAGAEVADTQGACSLDHARPKVGLAGRTPLERRQQAERQQKVAQVVGAHVRLKLVLCLTAWGCVTGKGGRSICAEKVQALPGARAACVWAVGGRREAALRCCRSDSEGRWLLPTGAHAH